MSFQPRNEHGKVILCENNQQGRGFRAYSADNAMVFPKGNVRIAFCQFLDPFREKHTTKQLVAEVIISGDALVILLSEWVFPQGIIQLNVIKAAVFSHTPD